MGTSTVSTTRTTSGCVAHPAIKLRAKTKISRQAIGSFPPHLSQFQSLGAATHPAAAVPPLPAPAPVRRPARRRRLLPVSAARTAGSRRAAPPQPAPPGLALRPALQSQPQARLCARLACAPPTSALRRRSAPGQPVRPPPISAPSLRRRADNVNAVSMPVNVKWRTVAGGLRRGEVVIKQRRAVGRIVNDQAGRWANVATGGSYADIVAGQRRGVGAGNGRGRILNLCPTFGPTIAVHFVGLNCGHGRFGGRECVRGTDKDHPQGVDVYGARVDQVARVVV